MIHCVVAAAVLAANGASRAQSDEITVRGDTEGGVGADFVDGLQILTSLQAGVGYTDNFFRQDSDGEQAFAALLQPRTLLTYAVPRFLFSAGAQGWFAAFDLPGNENDYQDGQVSAASSWRSATRHRFDWNGNAFFGHDPIGTRRTEDTPGGSLDRWRRVDNTVSYLFGVPADRVNLELRAKGSDLKYSSNRDFTRFLDFEQEGAAATVFYNVSPKSSLLAEVTAIRTVFQETAPGAFDRGGTEGHYRIGARWLSSGKTSGDIRIGLVRRNPRENAREDYSKFDWTLGVDWMPRQRDAVRLSSGRNIQQSYLLIADFLDNRFYGIEWKHDWSLRLVTRVEGRYIQTDFVGSQRNDDYAQGVVSADYRLTQNLVLLADVRLRSRDSNASVRDYDEFSAYLGMRFINY